MEIAKPAQEMGRVYDSSVSAIGPACRDRSGLWLLNCTYHHPSAVNIESDASQGNVLASGFRDQDAINRSRSLAGRSAELSTGRQWFSWQ